MAVQVSEVTREQVGTIEGAQAIVELLNQHGVECVFINPGTDTFPVQEAIARLQAQGRPTPRVVLCLHEYVAMSAAHGHAMISGRPQLVLVHVDVGTQNVGGAFHNAQRGRVGVVVCAGRAPLTWEGELRGGRDTHIHWVQEQMDQAGIVRQFVKWDYEVRRNENLQHVVGRAFQVAASEPAGPVYLQLPRELLMEAVPDRPRPPARAPRVTTPQADPAALGQAAEWLAQASNPLILTSYAGRNPAAVPALVGLAETLGAPVAELWRTRMNFPTDHPLYLGTATRRLVPQADAILIVDSDTPYIPLAGRPPEGARIIQLEIDAIKRHTPLWGFPVDLAVAGSPAEGLAYLVEALRRRGVPQATARCERWRAEHEAMRADWGARADGYATRSPIQPEWLARCVDRVLRDDDLLLAEAVTNVPVVTQLIERRRPGTFFDSGGSSLGWGLGAALGAKLAAPERRVVCLEGDGCFVFGQPVPALWSAAREQLPFLTVILNNACYNAVRLPTRTHYPDGASVTGNHFVAMDLDPSPNYAAIAAGCGVYGETITDPADVEPALRRALARVDAGEPVVLDVRLEPSPSYTHGR